MSVPRLSLSLCLVIALGSGALGGFPFAQYPDLRGSAPSFSPHLIYGGNDDLAGFSYFTKDFGGGESEVVFFTGPDSGPKMNDEIASIKDQLSSWPFLTTDPKEAQKDDKEAKPEPTVASPVPEESKEPSTPEKGEAADSTTPGSKVEEKQEAVKGTINGQYLPQKNSGFESPYPIFRLSGSVGYYPQPSTQFAGFPEFPSDYFRSQYLPLYNQYNSYQVPYVPSFPSVDTDYYNPGVFPSLYQNPFIVPSLIGGNSVVDKTASSVSKIDRRFKPEEAETTSVATSTEESSSDSEKKASEDSAPSEKGTEVPTSTEQMVEKSTTVSETAPTTAEENKGTDDTTAVNDAVALP